MTTKVLEYRGRAELYFVGADGLEMFVGYLSGPRLHRSGWVIGAVEVSS